MLGLNSVYNIRMNRQYLHQFVTVVSVLLMIGSMTSGFMFVGSASTTQNPQDYSFTSPTQSTQDTDTQEMLNQQSQMNQPETVSVPAYIDSHTIEDFTQTTVGDGRYTLSGVLNAQPYQPTLPFRYSTNVELLVFESTNDGRTLVAEDSQSISLTAGSIHPNKLQIKTPTGQTTQITQLDSTHSNTLNPNQMYVGYNNTTDTYTVKNQNGDIVYDTDGNAITSQSEFIVSGVRDEYATDFEFNLQVPKENQDYEYYLFVSGNEETFESTDYNAGTEAQTVLPQASLQESFTTGNEAASQTSISSYFNIQTNEAYTEESDVTFVTSYKSTLQQDDSDIYEELGLPLRGTYRETQTTPAGTVTGFTEATSTNNEFATFTTNSTGRLKVTTSTQTIPQNEPQTLIIRYAAPGDGNITVTPIDSQGAPVEEGQNSGKPLSDLGYTLPEDPTTKPYTIGQNANTNVAVIQLSEKEQAQINRYGELFLSYETAGTSDDFRLYCQSIITGTVDRDIDACGINAEQANQYTDGIIQNMSIRPASPSTFTGNITNNQKTLEGLDPSLIVQESTRPTAPPEVLTRGKVFIDVTVKNTGTTPISGESIDIFKNAEISSDETTLTNATVQYNTQDTETLTSVSDGTTHTFSLSDEFRGPDTTLTTDMNTGDGTIILTVTDNSGNSKEFVYDGHQGEISEQLNTLGPSQDWTVTVETELLAGQRNPEIQQITLEGKEIGDASTFKKQTRNIQPGETQTYTIPSSSTNGDIPTLDTDFNNRIVYQAAFYDDTETVEVLTNTGQATNNDNPTAVISGPNTLQRRITGSDTYRSGTQTITAPTCPESNTVNCNSNSDWELLEENVDSEVGTRLLTTTETDVPLNINNVSNNDYAGSTDPLNRAGINNPYKNLPGDSSQYTVASYSTIGETNTETIQSSKQSLIDRYGSYKAAQEAGWQVIEANVGEEVVDTEYAWFRFNEQDQAIQAQSSEPVDRLSPEFSQVTQQEYELQYYDVPLTKTQDVAVETRIQQENPQPNTNIWQKGPRTSYSADRWSEEEYTNEDGTINYDRVEEQYFYGNPGGEWEPSPQQFNADQCTTSPTGCLYFRPKQKSDAGWNFEWRKTESLEFRLHERPVTETQNIYSRTLYETEIAWETDNSGTLNRYEGPEYNERNTFSDATGVYSGDDSTPSNNAQEIINYQWSINGDTVERNVENHSFSQEISILANPVNFIQRWLKSNEKYQQESFTVTHTTPEDSSIQYQPHELELQSKIRVATLFGESDGSGSLNIKIVNEYGNERNVLLTGSDIVGDVETMNLRDLGFTRPSSEYTITYNSTIGPGEYPVIIEDSTLEGTANRGGESLQISESSNGQLSLGLTVTDNNGFTDSTTKTIDIKACEVQDCTTIFDDPNIQLTGYTPEADYVGGVANVKASVSGINSGNDFYVAELSPGDVSPTTVQSNICQSDETEMTAEEIRNNYDSWTGLNESQVTSRDDPYCVRISELGSNGNVGNVVSVREGQDTEVGTKKRVVWSGQQVSGYDDTIEFNINPRNTPAITVGENNFELTLRNVDEGKEVSTENMEIFFCHALNGNFENSKKPPEDRETRTEGGDMCPGLNSDFDTYDDSSQVGEAGEPAYDGVDYCPYSPTQQNWALEFTDSNQGSCDSDAGSNQDALATFTDFNRDSSNIEASQHMVYYDRYASVGNVPNNDGYSSSNLQLGYSPREQSQFDENYLQAYYPLSEASFDFEGVSPIKRNSRNSVSFGPEEYYYDISTPDSVITSVPAWSLPENEFDSNTYPYANAWFAADISGNNNHAPIFHTPTRITVQSQNNIPFISGTDAQYLYRGDDSKLLTRNQNGVFGSSAYQMNGLSYFVPFKSNSEYYQDTYDSNEVNSCNDSSCYNPRLNRKETPLNGPGWNQNIANSLADSNEFTLSMYIKPGVQSGTTSRKPLFSFYDWNGKKFGPFAGGQQNRMFTSFHSDKFFQATFKDYNTFSFRTNQSTPSRTVFGHIQYDSHGLVNLPSRVTEAENKPLFPELTGNAPNTIFSERAKKRLLIQSMGHSSTTSHLPPEIKTLRPTNGANIVGQQNPGGGYRHFVVTAEKGEEITYYIDGLPYDGSMLSKPRIDNGPLLGGEAASFGGLRSDRAQTGLMHLVGAEINKGTIQSVLQDYYISDYRLYDKSLTKGEIDEHVTIDSGTYDSYAVSMYDDEQISQMNLPTCNTESCTKEQQVRDILNGATPDDMTIEIDGELNYGEVTVTAYPLDADGDRKSDSKLVRTFNQTQSVEHPYYFDPSKGKTAEIKEIISLRPELQEQAIEDSEYDLGDWAFNGEANEQKFGVRDTPFFVCPDGIIGSREQSRLPQDVSANDAFCGNVNLIQPEQETYVPPEDPPIPSEDLSNPDNPQESYPEYSRFSSRPLPSFVGNELMMALENGTLTPQSAYYVAQQYDNNQEYIYRRNNILEEDEHYSSGDETGFGVHTLESYGITDVSSFRDAIGFNSTVRTSEVNTLDAIDETYNNWKISVEVKSRPHTQESPQVNEIRISTSSGDSEPPCSLVSSDQNCSEN